MNKLDAMQKLANTYSYLLTVEGKGEGTALLESKFHEVRRSIQNILEVTDYVDYVDYLMLDEAVDVPEEVWEGLNGRMPRFL